MSLYFLCLYLVTVFPAPSAALPFSTVTQVIVRDTPPFPGSERMTSPSS